MAFKGTSRECLYQNLGFELLKDRQWHWKLIKKKRFAEILNIVPSTPKQPNLLNQNSSKEYYKF